MKIARIFSIVFVACLILFAGFMELSPIDQSLPSKIKELENRIDALSKARQPYLGDWYEFNTSLFTYVSDNLVDIDDSIVLTDVFQIGDKVRFTQDGGYKYGYIIKLDSTENRLTLNGGSDYTFDNSAFSTFAISKLTSPVGFPESFNFAHNTSFSGGSGISITGGTSFYRMEGSLVIPVYYIQATWATTPTYGEMDLPFQQGVSSIIQIGAGAVNSTIAKWYLLSNDAQLTVDSLAAGGGNLSFSPVYIYFPPN